MTSFEVLHPTLEQGEGNEGTANFTHCFNIIEHLVTGSMKQTIIKLQFKKYKWI